MMSCCSHNNKTRKCLRKDGKIFNFPRRFSKKKCKKGPIKGFTMRSSCAPYKYCKWYSIKKLSGGKKSRKKRKKTFLYNPNNPKKSFDVYIDKNPKDTISIKYTTVDDIQNTIKKLERLYKNNSYNHQRIWQVGMIMKVRLESMYKRNIGKNIKKRYELSEKYFNFLSKRTKENTDSKRKKMIFRK